MRVLSTVVSFVLTIPFLLLSTTSCISRPAYPPAVLLDKNSRTVDEILLNEMARLGSIALRQAARKGQWPQIKKMLVENEDQRIKALYWYALPNGQYFTSEKDKVSANLRTREYFPTLLKGNPVIGFPVVGKTSKKKSLVVAVPIKIGRRVAGVLGTSFFAEAFNEQLQDIVALPSDFDFFALSPNGLTTFDLRDNTLIFDQMAQQKVPSLQKAAQVILSKDHGDVQYTWEGTTKKAIFQVSPLSKWKYALSYPVVSKE